MTPATDEQRDEDETPETTRSMDEELKVMGSILRTLSKLDEAAQQRIMAYLTARFAGRNA